MMDDINKMGGRKREITNLLTGVPSISVCNVDIGVAYDIGSL